MHKLKNNQLPLNGKNIHQGDLPFRNSTLHKANIRAFNAIRGESYKLHREEGFLYSEYP